MSEKVENSAAPSATKANIGATPYGVTRIFRIWRRGYRVSPLKIQPGKCQVLTVGILEIDAGDEV